MRVVGAAPAGQFTPPPSPAAALSDVQPAFPELKGGFVLYTGGIEPRKNIDRLLEAYARLPEELRGRHQLAVVCRVRADERAKLERRFNDLGIEGRVLLTGYVTDRQLVSLYGAAHLFVFPSLYEGYGFRSRRRSPAAHR